MSGETQVTREASAVYAPEAPGAERIPLGYRQTEAGVIPEGWNGTKLGNMITLQRGYDLPQRNRRSGSIPIVSSSGIYDTHNQPQVCGPGIVTGRYGTVGEVFFIKEDFWPLNTTLFVSDFKGNDPLFISYMLRTIDFASHSGKSGVPGVNRNDLHGLDVIVPPLPEQRAIAAALSDMDALISSLDRLISKKRAVKTAAMQQLLTGKQRLPGFSEEWEVKRLGEVAEMNSGGTPPSNISAYYDGNIPWVSITDMTKRGKYIVSTDRNLTEKGLANSAARIFPKGTVLYAMYASIGECSIAAVDLCSSQAILGIRPNKVLDNLYLYFLLLSKKEAITKLGQQGTQANLNAGMVKGLSVPMPSLEEQTAIAAVLSDMDAEIEALEARQEKTQQVKQGMMQELLTGRTRLVPERSLT